MPGAPYPAFWKWVRVTKLTMDEGVMTWNYTNVYADGQLFATYDAQGLHFDLDDWLGTRRVTTNYAGVVEQTCASLPYGDQLNCTGSVDAPDEQHFTGKTHDTESGLDYFGARYYSENDARWMSPDPLGGHMVDPQSLNKYLYVRDNPLTLTDSTGLDFALDCPKNNGTNCQGGHQYYRDKKGWHETVIRSDKNGNLTDQQGNKYSGSFNGKSITFSGANGNKSTGDWIQGSNSTSGITGSGPLSSNFSFTFYNHGTHQTLNFTFTYSGSMTRAFGELQNAGFTHWNIGDDIGFSEWRTDVAGRNSTHFLVWDPNWLERHIMSPPSTLPQGPGTRGEGHVGEYYPSPSGIGKHFICDVVGLC